MTLELQSATHTTFDGTASPTFSAPTTAGNAIIVIAGGMSATTAVTDDASNTYAQIAVRDYFGRQVAIWAAFDCAPAEEITVTSASGWTGGTCLEYEAEDVRGFATASDYGTQPIAATVDDTVAGDICITAAFGNPRPIDGTIGGTEPLTFVITDEYSSHSL
jgi:hypothetical protein